MIYQPRLDSIRLIAVLLVIISHWLPNSEIIKSFPHMGHVGVGIFFVLSGFLITGNLIRLKSINLKKALKIFYINRTLRIFPIYYLVLILFFFVNIEGWSGNYFYFLTYTTNFRLFEIQEWVGPFSHLWSLAIEEQFYLIWPIILLVAPYNNINLLIVFTFLASIIIKVILHLSCDNIFIDMLPFSQFDLFMIGGFMTTKIDILISKIKTTSPIKLLIYPLFISLLLLASDFHLTSNLLIGLLSFFLILITYSENWLVRLLDFKIFIFLGKISYGLYLYHNFIPLLERNLVGTETRSIFFSAILPNYNSAVYHLSIQILLLLFLSLISWNLIEKRFLKFKITKY